MLASAAARMYRFVPACSHLASPAFDKTKPEACESFPMLHGEFSSTPQACTFEREPNLCGIEKIPTLAVSFPLSLSLFLSARLRPRYQGKAQRKRLGSPAPAQVAEAASGAGSGGEKFCLLPCWNVTYMRGFLKGLLWFSLRGLGLEIPSRLT